jgi:hypothetical protein
MFESHIIESSSVLKETCGAFANVEREAFERGFGRFVNPTAYPILNHGYHPNPSI